MPDEPILSTNKQYIMEGITNFASRLPCWLGLLLAMFFYFFLHHFADFAPGKINVFKGLGADTPKQLFNTSIYYLQFIIPFIFSLWALISLIITQRKYGFVFALKTFAIALTISLAAFLFINSWPYTLPPQITNSTIVNKINEFLPAKLKNGLSAIKKGIPFTKKNDYVFSEKEISTAKERLLKNQQGSDKILFEIQLKSGRSLFAKNATITGETLTFENDKGLVVSMNLRDVEKVRKLIQK
ncbi:MAG: hypothetical protein KJ630_16725 [Proteobacteria bacterium]|nr:hypothetical protein [Pseudomonadota bacterium]